LHNYAALAALHSFPTRRSSDLRCGFGVAYDRTDDVLFSNARGNPPAFSRFNLCCGTSTQDFSTPFDGGVITYVLGTSNSATSYPDRKSTRLNSSHVSISYAVFC